MLAFRRSYHEQPSHAQLGYVYRQLCLLDTIQSSSSPEPKSSPFHPHPRVTEMFEEWCLRKRSRCSSGVTVYSLMTSPHPRYQDSKGVWRTQKYSCRHNCYYCPNEPAHKDNGWQPQARSYLYREPTVQRANRQKFSPSQQIWERGQVYLMNGHPVDKMEVIILGGTWSEYPRDYQEWFLGQVYWSANHLIEWCRLKSKGLDIIPPEQVDPEGDKIGYTEPGDSRVVNLPPYRGLEAEQEANQSPTNVCRVVGLTIETRPDAITPEILEDCRRWGVTRIQIGVQHTNQGILDLVNRGCSLQDTINSTRMLQDYGFKVVHHWMPDLPGSNPELDREMWRRILTPQVTQRDRVDYSKYIGDCHYWDLLADEWKIYPFSALPWSVCESWIKDGRYRSYGTDTLVEVLAYCKRLINRHNLGRIRIVRLIRDIPVPYIKAGNKVAHLRQVVEAYLQRHGERCVCIRCREIRDNRPALSYANWNMTVRRTPVTPYPEESPKHTPKTTTPKTLPTTNLYQSLLLLLTSIWANYLWDYVDRLCNLFTPNHHGKWYWGNSWNSTPMQDILLNLPINFEQIPETLATQVSKPPRERYAYECFLSLEGGRDFTDTPIYGFLRLRLTPHAGLTSFPGLKNMALVRELHVYGKSKGVVDWESHTPKDTQHTHTTKTNDTSKHIPNKHTQHHGVGGILLRMAEYQARRQGYHGIAIISGVGVRGYYRKRGYVLTDTYMVKKFR